MPTEYWYPISGAGHDLPAGHNNSINVGGANKNASTRIGGGRAGPPTHDDGASYVENRTNGTGGSQCFNIDWPSPMASYSGTLTAGYRYASIQYGGGWDGATTHVRFVNAAYTAGSDYVAAGDNGSYNTVGPISVATAATYRPGGGSWLVADFADDKTIFVDHYMSGLIDDACATTSHFGQIAYSPPSGGFVFLLGLAGLMAILNGPMDYQQFEKFLQWRHDYHPRRTILSAEENVQAWDEYKSYRHPRFYY